MSTTGRLAQDKSKPAKHVDVDDEGVRIGERVEKAVAGLALLVGSAVAVVVAWQAGQGVAATAVAVLVGAPGLALAWATFRADRRDAAAADTEVAGVADRLADQTRRQWSAEAGRRDLNQPTLDVAWEPASTSLSQPWALLQRRARASVGWRPPEQPAESPAQLAGVGSELVQVLARVPTGRVIVLGEPGTGKTTLLIRLVLDLLDRRMPGGPVPLLIPLASFDPDRDTFSRWLEAQIIRENQWLETRSAARISRARALLDARLVLPILDGLDEVRATGRDRVIAAINTAVADGQPLVLSSRVKAFRHAIRPGRGRLIHVDGAVAIRLRPLDPAQTAAYLIDSAGGHGPERWASVLTAVTTSPACPVAEALSTPLMANLARAIYNPPRCEAASGLPDPAELCDAARFPTRAAIEEHLLDGLVPAAYRPHPEQARQWSADQAIDYLRFLARHLEHRQRTTGLAWWEIHRATPKTYISLTATTAFGLALGLAFGAVCGLQYGFLFGFPFGFTTGLTFSVPLGLAARGRSMTPRGIFLHRPRLVDLCGRLGGLLTVGLGIGVAVGIALGIGAETELGLTFGIVFGIAGEIAFVLAFGLGLDTTIDTPRSADPRSVLAKDRSNAFALGLTVGIVFGLAIGIAFAIMFGLATGLAAGLAVGLAFGLTIPLASAWARFRIACLWLAWRGHLPVRLMAFLSDSHKRGILRQAGATWEFRHANLQHRLATQR
ncbi:NACHT domain-containing protein [Pseudofrankia saprophytica]|uniref:NACHT domain-containing protein n=1 Tax=Pseudofrankia saprophytica TaxID=298655 RepID=UPI000A00EE27|nr:NACHT domain-containing protein [Pseudofrankia saprophytica]